MITQKEWYTVDEAAEYLGVSRRTVYRLCQEGRLSTYTVGRERTRRFRKEDLDGAPQPLERVCKKKKVQDLTALSASSDPVLAELWDNEMDASYDAL